ncbi:hypothetical protein [Armatimonas sp.]|uniref:hypothetical protein n=1 Tax=Armatimonas sp. TaxID=1872638 RepID=UPI00374D4F3B
MEQDKQHMTDEELAALEIALTQLDDISVSGLGELMNRLPDIELDDEGEAWNEELTALAERASQILATPSPLHVGSLGELRAQARLTVDDVAEIVGLPAETIDYMEEDIPVTGTPRAFLRAIGELYGYAAVQVESVLLSQGSNGALGAAYKLRGEATVPSTTGEAVILPRSFSEILEETGTTEQQRSRWLGSTEEETEEPSEDDLFA